MSTEDHLHESLLPQTSSREQELLNVGASGDAGLRQRKSGKGDLRPLLTTGQTKFFTRDPTRTQAPVMSSKDDLAGEGGKEGQTLAGGDGELRFEDACRFPGLFRFTVWISACTTSPWRSLQNLHLVVVLAPLWRRCW